MPRNRQLILGALLVCCHACAPRSDSSQAPKHAAPDEAAGSFAYIQSCAACHGFDGEGLPGLGVPLKSNPVISEQTQGQLVAFLQAGRATDDPLNTSGIEMPPRGGNANLSDADLINIAAFLRSIAGAQ
jgi:cytochrome c553